MFYILVYRNILRSLEQI